MLSGKKQDCSRFLISSFASFYFTAGILITLFHQLIKMKKKNLAIRIWIAAGTAIFSPAYGQAQQTDSLRGKLIPEVIISATRSERNPAEVGRGITVISAADIQQSNYLNVGDLLAKQAGIYLVGAGQNPGMTQSIFLRGSNSNQTAILIDGVRITDPSAVNNGLDLSELGLADIDRIEIVRGSHSTLYGSSAIGGVVNIITRKNSQPGFHPVAELQAGKFGAGTSLFGQKLGLNYGWKSGYYINTQIANQRINGLDATVDTVTRANVYNQRDQDDFNRLVLTGKAGYRTDKWDVYGSYKNTAMQTDFDKRAYIDDDNATVDFKRHLFTYGAAYKISAATQVQYIGGYSRMFRETTDDSSSVDAAGTSDQTFSSSGGQGSTTTDELQLNFTGAKLKAVVGLGHYAETMNNRSYYYSNSAFGVYESRADLDTLNLHVATNSAFAHIDLNGSLLSEQLQDLSLAIGGRFNRHSKFGNYTTFEINPSYKLTPSTLLYVVIASGFNAPSLYQLYSPEIGSQAGITRGNQNLKPETSTSYEIGFKQTWGTTRIGVSFFRTQVQNTIEYVYLWSGNTPTTELSYLDYQGDTYLNLSRQTSRGIELDFNSELSPQIQIGGNINLVNGYLNINPADIETSQTQGNQVQLYNTGSFINSEVEVKGLTRRPNTANLNVTYKPTEKLAFRIDGRYAGTRSDIFYDAGRGPYGALGTTGLSDYTLFDFTAKYQVTSQLAAGLRLENALNKTYQEINGFSTRGRGVYLSLRYGL